MTAPKIAVVCEIKVDVCERKPFSRRVGLFSIFGDSALHLFVCFWMPCCCMRRVSKPAHGVEMVITPAILKTLDNR